MESGQQDGPDIVESRPLVFQDVWADVPMGVHTGVKADYEDLDCEFVVRVAAGDLQGKLILQVLVDRDRISMDGPHPLPT